MTHYEFTIYLEQIVLFRYRMTFNIQFFAEKHVPNIQQLDRVDTMAARWACCHLRFSRQYDKIYKQYKDSRVFKLLKFNDNPRISFQLVPKYPTDLQTKKIGYLDNGFIKAQFRDIEGTVQQKIKALEYNLFEAIDYYQKYEALRDVRINESIRAKHVVQITIRYSDYIENNPILSKLNEYIQAEHISKILRFGIESEDENFIEIVMKTCLNAGYISARPKFVPSKVRMY